MKNWPQIFPLVYHDIEAEVPAAGQELAKRSYFIWQCTKSLLLKDDDNLV